MTRIIILFLVFFISNANSMPRCDKFYQQIYDHGREYPSDEDLFLYSVLSIGIILDQKWNLDNEAWEIVKNNNGYFTVAKVEKESLAALKQEDFNKIMIGDEIVSINGKTIDQIYYKGDKSDNISSFFKENEKVEIKLLRKLNNGLKKEITISSSNEEISYNEPFTEIYINYIDLNEKNGTYEISLKSQFSEYLNDGFSITNDAHKFLVQALDIEGETNFYGKYPSAEAIKDLKYDLFECPFSEEKWTNTNTRVPYYTLRWDNLVFEDKNKKKAKYFVSPYFDEDNKKWADVTFENNTSLIIKNDYNLKSFPFDRQNITLKLYSEAPLDYFKVSPSNYTHLRLLEFKKENNIEGWDIKKIALEYDIKKYPEQSYLMDAVKINITVDRKSGYYIFKIIIPIILILMICWSSIWINPKEIESRLTITIVCLLSLIAYNFVIDSDMPKLEYLTIMDYIILISYIYAAIPNFISVYSHHLITRNKKKAIKYEFYEKKYGLPSYLLIIFLIVIINASNAPENTNAMFTWVSMKS